MEIRPATVGDAEGINAVYNHFVATSAVTFDIEPRTLEWRRGWLEARPATGPHRAMVAEEDGAVVGFASSGPYRERAAYATSIETSVYVAHGHGRRGLGTGLYGALFGALAQEELHRAYAGIVPPNPGSVALHERFGFVHVGTFHEQGRKFGRYWDVAWYERPLP
jgi:phosphinothricin acetyltransferase